ncbi:MAG: hypothetical protein R3A48_10410 [Polyangiales bacterium]
MRERRGAAITTDGDFALVPRPDEGSRPAGLFYAARRTPCGSSTTTAPPTRPRDAPRG